MSRSTRRTRIPKEHVDGCRAVALGFKPRGVRPAWAKRGLRRGCSANDLVYYEKHPLAWEGIQLTARRGRLCCERNGLYCCEFEEYETGPEPAWRELTRFELLLDEAIETVEPHLDEYRPSLARAFGDLHWAADFLGRLLNRRKLGPPPG